MTSYKSFTFKVTENPQYFSIGQLSMKTFNKLRVEKMVYKNSGATNVLVGLKINSFQKSYDVNNQRGYTLLSPCLASSTLAYDNNGTPCMEWCSETAYTTDIFNISIHEDGSLVSTAHLTANPAYVEITLE